MESFGFSYCRLSVRSFIVLLISYCVVLRFGVTGLDKRCRVSDKVPATDQVLSCHECPVTRTSDFGGPRPAPTSGPAIEHIDTTLSNGDKPLPSVYSQTCPTNPTTVNTVTITATVTVTSTVTIAPSFERSNTVVLTTAAVFSKYHPVLTMPSRSSLSAVSSEPLISERPIPSSSISPTNGPSFGQQSPSSTVDPNDVESSPTFEGTGFSPFTILPEASALNVSPRRSVERLLGTKCTFPEDHYNEGFEKPQTIPTRRKTALAGGLLYRMFFGIKNGVVNVIVSTEGNAWIRSIGVKVDLNLINRRETPPFFVDEERNRKSRGRAWYEKNIWLSSVDRPGPDKFCCGASFTIVVSVEICENDKVENSKCSTNRKNPYAYRSELICVQR